MSRWMYDVYISFGGPDTRKTFVDPLYNGLKRHGIHVCMDDSVLGGPEVINDPIEKSRFLMVIISDKYASSSLCMRKLVKILKLSKNSSEHKIIPVFYNFNPEMVREQCGSYAEAFAKHEESNEAEVDEWRKALSMAASLYGWVLNFETNGYEYKFIDHISKEILKMLSDAPLHSGIWVHKSELNYRHPNHSKRQLAIFWDMENCCIPNGVHPQDVYDNILACLRHQTEIEWEAVMFSAYADLLNVSPKISEGCMKADMNLRHVPNGIKDGSGKAILVDLFLYAHDNPPPSSIILISGDVSFSSALQVLHQRRHHVIFVIPSRVGILSALTYGGAIDIWDWSNVVRGEGLVPSSRFQIKENSDAVNKEESMESGVSMGSQPSSEYNPDDVYDVYLSFRGLDTRKTFVDHLYNGLKRNALHVCIYDNVLGGPEEIDDVIEKSRFLMVIFSDNYASSSSCLRELVKILDLSANDPEHKFIPVFYNVTPQMVREQCGSYAQAFADHEVSNKAEVDEWRKALFMAASFPGWVLNSETNGYEYKFIDDMSKEIRNMLSDAPLQAGIWVHKSELNYHHPNHSKRQLAIFWDMETCCIPNGIHPKEVYDNILACLRNQTEIEWEVIRFSAYADFSNVSQNISEGCMKARMNLSHVPNEINNASGKAILVDLLLYAHDNPPPSSIMLISGDVGFSNALHVLHRRRHPVIFVIPSRLGVLSALTYDTIDIWDWSNVVRGEWLVPTSRF